MTKVLIFFPGIKYHFIKDNLNATMLHLDKSVKLSNNSSSHFKLIHFPTSIDFYYGNSHINVQTIVLV
jgi:hypothetical protein